MTDHGNADALSLLLAGDDPLYNKEEEGKGSMVLTIWTVDQQLYPNSNPLKLGVLAWESKMYPVIWTVMRYDSEEWLHTISPESLRKCNTTSSWLIHSLQKKDVLCLKPE